MSGLIIVICLNLLYSKYDKASYSINSFIIYDPQKGFIDLPYSPMSVNARVLYNNLPKKQKQNVNSKDEIFQFTNSFIVQFIFCLIFDQANQKSSLKKWITLDRNYLKELLVNFKYLDIDEMIRQVHLELPKGFSIKKVSKFGFVISTRQGFINFKWELGTINPCPSELIFLAQMQNKSLKNCTAVNIKLKMEYGYKPLSFFSSSANRMQNYLEMCVDLLNEYDINSIIKNAQTILMTELIKKMDINTCKNALLGIQEIYFKK